MARRRRSCSMIWPAYLQSCNSSMLAWLRADAATAATRATGGGGGGAAEAEAKAEEEDGAKARDRTSATKASVLAASVDGRV